MRQSFPKIAAVLAAVLAVAAGGCQREPESPAFTLPADAVALLPAAPSAILVVASLDAVEAAHTELEALGGDEPLLPPEVWEQMDARAALDRHWPELGDRIAGDRPLVLAMQAPPPMAQQPALTMILPLEDPAAALPEAPAGHPEPMRRGAYVALSSSASYAPADTLPALAQNLQEGLMTAAVDLAGVIALYRPLVEMGLGALAMRQEPGAPDEGLSPEQARALTGTVRKVMDGLERLDLTMDLAVGELTLAALLGVTADGALAPGPQPDMAAALELSGYLPADADMVEVIALDQSHQMDLFRDFYVMSLREEMAALPPETAAKYEAWFTGYLDMYGTFACPAAASADFTDAGVEMLVIARPEDPAAMAQAVADQLTALSDVGLGVVFTPGEPLALGEVTASRWQMDLDPAALAAWEAQAPDSQGALQAAQMTMVLRDLMPSLALVATGSHVLVGATDDDAAFAALHERVRRGRADPEPRAAAAAAGAGADCHQVVLGDLTPAFNWLMRIVGDLGAAGDLPVLDVPVPYVATMTVAPGGYGVTASTDLPALQAAVLAIRAMGDH